MRKGILSIFATLFAALLFTCPATADSPDWVSIAKRYQSCLVYIETDVQYTDTKGEWLALGVFITLHIILTNAHVVLDEDQLTLKTEDIEKWIHAAFKPRRYSFAFKFKGDVYSAHVYAVNAANDTALLAVDDNVEGVSPAPLGDSDALQVGEKVLAIGIRLDMNIPRHMAL